MDARAKKALEYFLREDIGMADITSRLLPKVTISARIISRQRGIVAGVLYAREIFVSRNCKVKISRCDGSKVGRNDTIMTVSGSAYSVLSCERTALNLMSRMSGIATATNSMAAVVKKSNPKVLLYSTRKTAPGLRIFDKEAVAIGGGRRHRLTLDEMIMIKDNHLAVMGLRDMVRAARKHHGRFEVEVETLEDAVLAAREGAPIIMLDNMPPREISRTVAALKREGLRKKVTIEASGGIDASNLRSYAKSGVDMISVGWLTSSAKGLDLSLEVS